MSLEYFHLRTAKKHGFIITTELTAAGINHPGDCVVSRLDIKTVAGNLKPVCAKANTCKKTCHVRFGNIVLV
ncbi:MAG: hypothetical protein WCT01_00515 [Candidatus Shapirobacteria bacterium]